MSPHDIREAVVGSVRAAVLAAGPSGRWREPLVGFAVADDPGFERLRKTVDPSHALPSDILQGARSVVCFFLPFDEETVRANAVDRTEVARAWATAYVETNAFIGAIADMLTRELSGMGFRAAAEPATGRFDRERLTSTWSHKSAAVIAGLGTLGVHRMLITDSGCAGRIGSLVTDAELAVDGPRGREHCLHRAGGDCLECVRRCPVGALRVDGSLDKQGCWSRCQRVAEGFRDVGLAEVCGKCAQGPCAMVSAVRRQGMV
jgi:epoxyqueuosine reductase